MSNLRFVASAMVFLPVVLGVGAGVLIDGTLGTRGVRRDAPGRLMTLAVLLVVGLAAVLGVPPNRLSPDATWRIAYANGESAFKRALTIRDSRKTTQDAGMQMCAFGLTQVEGDGTLIGMLPGGGSEVEPWSMDLPDGKRAAPGARVGERFPPHRWPRAAHTRRRPIQQPSRCSPRAATTRPAWFGSTCQW